MKKMPERAALSSKNRLSNPLIIVTLLGAMAIGIGGKYIVDNFTSMRASDRSKVAGLLWPARTLQAFEFEGTKGTFDLAALKGKWSMLFFGYLTCPDICPTTLSTLSASLSIMREQSVTDVPQVVFVSVDPARDTVDNMKPYVKYFDDAFIGATAGSVEQLNQLTDQLYIPHSRAEADADGQYEVSHGASILLFDPEMRRVGIIATPHTPENIISRYQAIKNFINTQS